MKKTALYSLFVSALAISSSSLAVDAKYYGNQIIIKFKPTPYSGKAQVMNASKMQALSSDAKLPLNFKRTMGSGARVLTMNSYTSPEEMDKAVARLRARDDIEYAEIDFKRYAAVFPATAPNDSSFANGHQWYLQDNTAAADRGAINAEAVWQQGITGNGVTIAVVDTGTTPHNDLGSNIIAGYDFIGLDPDGSSATDGDGTAGRDSDPSDPGDLVTQNQKDTLPPLRDDPNCSASMGGKSSWHGTLVSGVLNAVTDNTIGIAGLVPNARVVVSRALGRCGGYNSDLMDAARWSAGLAVPGVPANANPAKIINLSLGGGGGCSNTEQSAINSIVANGAVVVVAAGNEGQDSAGSAPGNCVNTINVGATTRRGGETEYTNFGEEIDISAPGGSSPLGTATAITTTSQNAAVGPITNTSLSDYARVQGTSFSAPIVTGVIAMMLEKTPSLTPQQIYGTLLANVTSFPTDAATAQGGDAPRNCNTSRCGTGIVNAKAVYDALNTNNITTQNFPSKESIASNGSTTTTTPTTPTPASGGGGGGSISHLLLLFLSVLGIRRKHF